MGLNEELSAHWAEFCHEVNIRTEAMLYLLHGAHSLHQHAASLPSNAHLPVSYPRLVTYPRSGGENWAKHLGTGGMVEASIWKTWIIEVYGLWEDRYRSIQKRLFEEAGAENAIRPKTDVLGDLRHIRNNLVHGGIARAKQAGSCGVLRWFRPGDQMQIRFVHILDFLNQLGLLGAFGQATGRVSWWSPVDPRRADEMVTPRLISVAPHIDPDCPDPLFRFGVGAVFENAAHGNVPLDPPNDDQIPLLLRAFPKMRIGSSGNLEIPGVGSVLASNLYKSVTSGNRTDGPGRSGPRFQIAESPGPAPRGERSQGSTRSS